jgi:hypothetical protein|uniref:hypothetical protein n=1 Tax=Polynucleobacter sp. TaxID=2029855 RepID=UPI004048CC10
MSMQITSSSPVYVGLTTSGDSQVRQGYLGALAAALRNGNVVAATQALIELRGVGGGVSPAALFNTIDKALSTGKEADVKSASIALDQFRGNRNTGSSPLDGQSSKEPMPAQLMAASGLGTLINTKA